MARNSKGQFLKGTGEGIKKGHIFSSETKEKMSKSLKGRVFTREHLEKLSLVGKNNKRALGMKHTAQWKKENSERMKGNKHNYQGGKTESNLKIRNSIEYKLWRKSVFERDNYTCIWCKQTGGKLNADHIKPFSLYPELRLAIDNGRTLCVPCHKTTETYGFRIKRLKK